MLPRAAPEPRRAGDLGTADTVSGSDAVPFPALRKRRY